MQTYQFKQHKSKRAILLAVIYLLVLFIAAYFWLGGINGMADGVNNLGRSKTVGFLIGFVILAPLFILLQFFHPVITVDVDDQKLTLRQKAKQHMMIHYNAIGRIELNTKNINRLDIYDKQHNLLTYLHPSGNPEVLQSLIKIIIQNTGFETKKAVRKIMGGTIDTIIGSNKLL